jgi:hypothetical protein
MTIFSLELFREGVFFPGVRGTLLLGRADMVQNTPKNDTKAVTNCAVAANANYSIFMTQNASNWDVHLLTRAS